MVSSRILLQFDDAFYSRAALTMITHQGTSTSAERRSDGAVLTPFALCLTKHLAAGNGAGANLVFSPVSVYAALALVAAGARGRTLQELLAALGARSRDELATLAGAVVRRALADRSGSGGPAVTFASAVWHDAACQVRQGFRDAAAASFNAETRAVDFHNEPEEAVCEINNWVATATNDLIDSILAAASLRPDTSLVVANAIYLKGKWKEPFNEAKTTVDKFYRLDGSAADARFMSSGSSQLISFRDGLKVLKLPYEWAPPRSKRKRTTTSTSKHHVGRIDTTADNREVPWYAMYIFLPDARGGLPELVEKITSMLAFWRYRLPVTEVAVGEFRLPKFKLSFSRSLTGVLRVGMGVNAAFDASEADLSDLAKDDGSGLPLFAGEICHKAVIEVNEEGTVAAAATHISYYPTCPVWSPPKIVDFVADHPFVFFVVEEISGAIMFVGHVLDPTK